MLLGVFSFIHFALTHTLFFLVPIALPLPVSLSPIVQLDLYLDRVS